MTKMTNLRFWLMICSIALFGAAGCAKSEQDSAEGVAAEAQENAASAPTNAAPDWLLRGGSINRASLMSEWKPLGEQDRLAASADLVTMQLRHADGQIPEPAKLEELSRKLEAKLSEMSAEGTNDDEYVGNVVDEVWPTIQ